MRLRQLAKDPDSGRVGCPSVHLDEDSGLLLVQGDGTASEVPGRAYVRIAASIVRDGLGEHARSVLPDGATLVVFGEELDIALLPNPLPGERAVWSTYEELRGKLRDVAVAVAEL